MNEKELYKIKILKDEIHFQLLATFVSIILSVFLLTTEIVVASTPDYAMLFFVIIFSFITIFSSNQAIKAKTKINIILCRNIDLRWKEKQ